MFNTIVRTIGHEVNNSLGSVMSVLESLAEMHSDDALTSGAIAGCGTSCANLVEFVRGYADIVKLPAPVMEQVNLGDWIMRLKPTLQALAASYGVELNYNLGEGERRIAIDPMLMECVLINVVKNAAESIAARLAETSGTLEAQGVITVSLTWAESKREWNAVAGFLSPTMAREFHRRYRRNCLRLSSRQSIPTVDLV